MEAHDYSGEHQADLKRLVRQYEAMLQDGGISFLETDSFLMLADYYEDENHAQLAVDALTYALEQHPFSAALYIRKAQLLVDQQNYTEAFDLLDQAMIYEPSSLDIYLTQADIHMRLFEQDKALEVVKTARQYASKDETAELHLLEATICETKGAVKAAIRHLQRALKTSPKHEMAMTRLWELYDSGNHYQEAANFFNKFIDNHPYSYWAWNYLGLAQMYLGLLEKATESFDYAIVIDEKFEPAYHYYIDALIGLGRIPEALHQIKEYEQLFELGTEMWYRLGQCNEYEGNYKVARDYYVKVLQKTHLNGRIYHSIGNCYVEEESWRLAEQAYLDAYKIDPYSEEYCLALADTYDALGYSEKAHEFYHKALAIAPKDIRIWIHYIEFLIDEESYSLAIEMILEAKEYLDETLLDYAYAAVLLESGQRQEGLIVLGQALIENYALHRYLFKIAPQLEYDATLPDFIERYKEED